MESNQQANAKSKLLIKILDKCVECNWASRLKFLDITSEPPRVFQWTFMTSPKIVENCLSAKKPFFWDTDIDDVIILQLR